MLNKFTTFALNKYTMNIRTIIDPQDYTCGVLVARFQVDELHDAHKGLIDMVAKHHRKILIFLGVSNTPNTKINPLDFATRKAMIQEYVPNAIVLPQKDNRCDITWSNSLDSQINMVFGEASALLYGSRDSFIPHYHGRHATTELISNGPVSGTQIRNEISKEIRESRDFRAGVIHANYAQRAVTYPTVDIVVYNEDAELLLARKASEKNLRFIGGFVDRNDSSYETAARREFMEETGGNCEMGPLTYVTSKQIDDWRYRKEESGIMTTLFIAPRSWGLAKASDDIAELKWVSITEFATESQIKYRIMEEHVELMQELIKKITDTTLDIKILRSKLIAEGSEA